MGIGTQLWLTLKWFWFHEVFFFFCFSHRAGAGHPVLSSHVSKSSHLPGGPGAATAHSLCCIKCSLCNFSCFVRAKFRRWKASLVLCREEEVEGR